MIKLTRDQLSDIVYKHLQDLSIEIETECGGSLEACPADDFSDFESQLVEELINYYSRCISWTTATD